MKMQVVFVIDIALDGNTLKKLGENSLSWIKGLIPGSVVGLSNISEGEAGKNPADPSPTPPDEDDGESGNGSSDGNGDEGDDEGGTGENPADPSPTPPDEDDGE